MPSLHQNLTNNDAFNGVIVLSASVVILLALLLLAVWVYRQVKALNKKVNRLQQELKVANSNAIGMGQHLMALEKQLLEKPAGALHPHQNTQQQHAGHPESESLSSFRARVDTEGSVYDDARQLLTEGRSIRDVAHTCQLSYAEVSLLQALGQQNLQP